MRFFPKDLRNWVSADALLLWVEDEAADVQKRSAMGHPSSEHRPPIELLKLIGFAYATGTLEPYSILGQCRNDPSFIYLCGSELPAVKEISQFRFRHRKQILLVVTNLFLRALSSRSDSRRLRSPDPDLYAQVKRLAEDRLNIARHLAVDE